MIEVIEVDCVACAGEGAVPCDECDGRGGWKCVCSDWSCHHEHWCECPKCHGEKEMICDECDGNGWIEEVQGE